MDLQLVAELGIVKVEGIVVNLEQLINISEHLVIEFEICMSSIIFCDAWNLEWLPII